ncbi:MAG: BON domain-containing protein [Alphaproteobacteria bacterium]|nr:BON domain-containing protein [Alphaproteobacteria bacterium]
MTRYFIARFAPFMLAPLVLSANACAPLAVAGAGTAGVAVAQERSVGTAVDDATIHTKIWNKYLQSGTNNIYTNVAIDVNEGVVLLTGPVESADGAARAVQLAWEVEGVREVINEIQITNRGGPAVFAQDAWITTQAKSRLIAEKNVKSVNYTIETVNSVIYLMGIAQNEDELARVLNVLSRVKGVRRVVSHARLKNDPRRNTSYQPE